MEGDVPNFFCKGWCFLGEGDWRKRIVENMALKVGWLVGDDGLCNWVLLCTCIPHLLHFKTQPVFQGFNPLKYLKETVRLTKKNLAQRFDHLHRLEYLVIGIADEHVLTDEDGEGLAGCVKPTANAYYTLKKCLAMWDGMDEDERLVCGQPVQFLFTVEAVEELRSRLHHWEEGVVNLYTRQPLPFTSLKCYPLLKALQYISGTSTMCEEYFSVLLRWLTRGAFNGSLMNLSINGRARRNKTEDTLEHWEKYYTEAGKLVKRFKREGFYKRDYDAHFMKNWFKKESRLVGLAHTDLNIALTKEWASELFVPPPIGVVSSKKKKQAIILRESESDSEHERRDVGEADEEQDSGEDVGGDEEEDDEEEEDACIDPHQEVISHDVIDEGGNMEVVEDLPNLENIEEEDYEDDGGVDPNSLSMDRLLAVPNQAMAAPTIVQGNPPLSLIGTWWVEFLEVPGMGNDTYAHNVYRVQEVRTQVNEGVSDGDDNWDLVVTHYEETVTLKLTGTCVEHVGDDKFQRCDRSGGHCALCSQNPIPYIIERYPMYVMENPSEIPQVYPVSMKVERGDWLFSVYSRVHDMHMRRKATVAMAEEEGKHVDDLLCHRCGIEDGTEACQVCDACWRGQHASCGGEMVFEDIFFCEECNANFHGKMLYMLESSYRCFLS